MPYPLRQKNRDGSALVIVIVISAIIFMVLYTGKRKVRNLVVIQRITKVYQDMDLLGSYAKERLTEFTDLDRKSIAEAISQIQSNIDRYELRSDCNSSTLTWHIEARPKSGATGTWSSVVDAEVACL